MRKATHAFGLAKDETLIEECRNGNREAFGELIIWFYIGFGSYQIIAADNHVNVGVTITAAYPQNSGTGVLAHRGLKNEKVPQKVKILVGIKQKIC